MRLFLIILCFLAAFSAQATEIPSRVISVGGALTEMVYALGQEDRLVGSDTTSYYPPAAEKLPKVGYQRNLSAEGILSLRPDLLLINEDAGPLAILAQLQNAGLKIIKFRSAKSLADIRENFQKLGEILGNREKAARLVRDLDGTLAELNDQVKAQQLTPSVLFLMNHGGGTPMVAGTRTSADALIELAGGRNVAATYEGYKPLTPEAVVEYAPDIILITTRSLQMIGGKEELLKFPGMSLTPAGRQGKILNMDGLLLLGFGPRTGQAAVMLHEKLQAGK